MNYQLQRQSATKEWVHFISSDFIENLLFTFVRYRDSQFNFFYDNWRIVRNSDGIIIAQKHTLDDKKRQLRRKIARITQVQA